MKNLEKLIEILPSVEVSGKKDIAVHAVGFDSRKVVPGSLFICLSGSKVDGHNYIRQAREAGAVAVVVEKPVSDTEGLTVLKVPDSRIAMQHLVPYFFDYPSRKLRMIGVTGTNGKTTTTYLIKSVLERAGYKTGVIGTIQTLIGDRILPVQNTTPDVVDLQAILAEMVNSEVDYAIMEVSSHALALHRVAGCEYDVGIFTNITRDHLDFHNTFENYTEAKALLFKSISMEHAHKPGKMSVINMDDAAGDTMKKAAGSQVLTYGVKTSADIMAEDIHVGANGVSFKLKTPKGETFLQLKITGLFNVYNVLGAVGALLAEGIELAVIKSTLESFTSVSGRFELVDCGQPFTVIVDYAHTPDGLENILKTAKQFAKNRIILVFGCGGDRDRTKRPIMGKLAAEYADIIVATSDNPRSESPEFILEEIEEGILEGLNPVKSYEKIVDRREAIRRALQLAQPKDVVLIAGKGHETYQILKDRTIDFDDKAVAREIIEEMK